MFGWTSIGICVVPWNQSDISFNHWLLFAVFASSQDVRIISCWFISTTGFTTGQQPQSFQHLFCLRTVFAVLFSVDSTFSHLSVWRQRFFPHGTAGALQVPSFGVKGREEKEFTLLGFSASVVPAAIVF